MEWTTDKPTEPGYYWYKGPHDKPQYRWAPRHWEKIVVEVKITKVGGMLRFCGDTIILRLDDLPDTIEFYGPIEEPSDKDHCERIVKHD